MCAQCLENRQKGCSVAFPWKGIAHFSLSLASAVPHSKTKINDKTKLEDQLCSAAVRKKAGLHLPTMVQIPALMVEKHTWHVYAHPGSRRDVEEEDKGLQGGQALLRGILSHAYVLSIKKEKKY